MNPLVRCLDLFCCEGGAGMGYHRAGMEVTGVDIEPQPRYPFAFAQADALEFLREFGDEFDFIHASPPCQHFTKYKNCRPDIPTRYKDLIEPTRKALIESGKPWVMENVVGAPLRNPVVLCGSMFGLDVRRHRLFETSFPLPQMECNHAMWEPNRFPGGRSRERGHARVKCRGTVEVGRWNIPMDTQRAAMGIDWITDVRKLSEAIPPAYTEWIARQWLSTANAPAEARCKASPPDGCSALIASAPRDRDVLLAWRGGWHVGRWVADSLVHGRDCWMIDGGTAIEPTHWSDLPPLPNAPEQARGTRRLPPVVGGSE